MKLVDYLACWTVAEGWRYLNNVLIDAQVVLLQCFLGGQLAQQHLHWHQVVENAGLVAHSALVAVPECILKAGLCFLLQSHTQKFNVVQPQGDRLRKGRICWNWRLSTVAINQKSQF